MSKHLKLFETQAEYDNFITTSDFILPNVSRCLDTKHVYYNPQTKSTPPPSHSNEINDDGSFLGKDGITYKTMNFPKSSVYKLIWLDRSLGATSPKELGIEYDSKMSISDVEEMIKQKLGDEWRLPSKTEIVSLFSYFDNIGLIPLDKFKDDEETIEWFKLKDEEFYLKSMNKNVRSQAFGTGGSSCKKNILKISSNNINFLTNDNAMKLYFTYNIVYKYLGCDGFSKIANVRERKLSSKIENKVYILPVKVKQ